MKNSAAVPSGAAEKMRLRDLPKLMPIILRSLPRELDRLCRLIPVASIDSFTPVHSALQLAHLSRSTPVGSIHHAFLCRSTRRVMSSCTCDVSRVVARWIVFSEDEA